MKVYDPDCGPFYQGEIWNRSKLIQHCIEKHSYESYLEIGFGNPDNPNNNWQKISAPRKVCVDPWDITPDFVLKMTSDEFFRNNTETFDIVFIDGDHRAEQVYKDIVNSLEVLNPGGLILTHDNSPRNAEEESAKISGDGWKAIAFLRQRSDLDICVVPADTGVSMIKKRKNSNQLTTKLCDWCKERREIKTICDACDLHKFLLDEEPDFSKLGYNTLASRRIEILNLVDIHFAINRWLPGD